MTNREAVLADIAKNSLDCIEMVSSEAEGARSSHRRSSASAFASINTLNSPQQVNSLGKVADTEMEALAALIEQPVIARIQFTNENDEEDTIFITRSTPRSVPGFKIASYRAPLGRIASLAAGDEGTFRFGSTERDLLVDSSARLKPQREHGQWDSKDSEIDIRGLGRFTVGSLRELLEPRVHVEEGELESLWDDETDANVLEGVRRAILTKMGLRDQPILDRHQDEIFRMPINSRCFLSGPPGTGKTTTLIRRLGQKTDRQALEESEEEIRLVRQVEEETGRQHESSWILFSPTELLRQYVKEAFNKEGLAASDGHIRTWEEFRRELAREELGLLRTSAGTGPFVERRAQDYLKPEVIDEAKWYDDFRDFLDESVAEELRSDAEFLAKSSASDLSAIGDLLGDAFKSPGRDFYAHTMRSVAELVPEIREAIASRSDAISRILTRARNALTYEDRNFPDLLREEISRQLTADPQDADEEDELEAVLDDEDEQTAEPQAGRPVSRQQGLMRYERALKSLAKARWARRRVSEKSQDGMLLAWLSPNRTPEDDEISELGKLLAEQSRLRKFERLERLFLRGIPTKYKRFRTEMAKTERWYKATPAKASDIHWQELDLVILATLQIANELLTSYRSRAGFELPTAGPLATFRYMQRAQVLVDEATDFSRVQLACMHELAHPAAGSFFLCGDINQRLTLWGLKSNDALDWIGARIERKSITVSYRQSQRLVDVAKQIATIGGSDADDIILPDRLDAEGLPPIWQTHLSDNATIAEWLTQRIHEIDRMVQKATTIAVLVNEEEHVEPLALELNDRLEEINLSAVACKDGKVVGNDRDVRVFNIQHIKGLEFEAVFFVDLDKTIAQHPDLFSKYLYVGATRAATYLGVTFHGDIPEQIEPLAHHFGQDWSL